MEKNVVKKLLSSAISLNLNGFRIRRVLAAFISTTAATCKRKQLNLVPTFKYAIQGEQRKVGEFDYDEEEVKKNGDRRTNADVPTGRLDEGVHRPQRLMPLEDGGPKRQPEKRRNLTTRPFKLKHKANQAVEFKSRNHGFENANETSVLFGIHPVLLALRSKRREMNKLFVKNLTGHLRSRLGQIVELAREMQIPTVKGTQKHLDKLSGHRPHQGVCLDVGRLDVSFVEDEEAEIQDGREHSKPSFWLLLNEIHDPMNLGAILRTAYYYGVDKVLGPSRGNCSLSPVVSKASSGILEIIRYNYVKDIPKLLKTKSSEGWDVVGTVTREPSTESLIVDVDHYVPCKPSILIIGNEGKGLDPNVLSLCNVLLTIPQHVIQEPISLNVSVATGIILHTLRRNQLKLSTTNLKQN